MEKNSIVLLGAGAAIPWDAPSTKTITQKLCSDNTFRSRTGQPLGAWINDKLRHFYHRDPDSVNFETILNAVDWLCSFYCAELRQGNSEFKVQLPAFFSGKDDLEEILDFHRIYQHDKTFWKAENPRAHFYGNWNDYDYFFEAVYRLFINLIIEEVEKYDRNLTNEGFKDINQSFNNFFEEVSSKGLIRGYTLNYDRFIPKISKLNFFEGFTSNTDGIAKFDSKKVLCESQFNCFYNLHGSIHFKEDWPRHVELETVQSIYNFGHGSSDHNDQESRKLINSNIITGLNKSSRILQNPYSQFYHTFYNDCITAQCVYIIGYSFTDIHINKAIMEGSIINSNQKIIVVGFDVIGDENVELFVKENDLFSISDRKRNIWLDANHGINKIVDQKNIDRIFYFRKGFQNFLKWKIWENV